MAQNSNQKPGFFWQGTFILLPVAVLAVVSLISLRQEARDAELDARNRAAENTLGLARAVRLSVNDELHRFFQLQNAFLTNPASAAAGVTSSDPALTADILKWERDYPLLKLADAVSVVSAILSDGRQVTPPIRPAFPVPPKWYVDLSARQKDRWRELRAATNAAEAAACEEAFLASNPSADARLAAFYVTNMPDPLAGEFRVMATESGISFQDVACFRIISAAKGRLSDRVVSAVWNQVLGNPSFVAPRLLELTEGLTNNADISIRQKVAWMESLWTGQSRSAKWLESIRRLPDLRTSTPRIWSHWTANEEALAIMAPLKMVNPQSTPDGESLAGPGYLVWFVPRAVVEAIFAKAVAENGFLIPEYAFAEVSVEARPLHQPDRAAAPDGKDLLGRAAQTVGTDPVTQDAVHFNLGLFLISKEQMLISAHRRARLFGGLILAAVFAGVAGLVSARRAFYRQLRLNEMKSNFVSSVSHELRAPIASVRLMAENLEGGRIPERPRQQEYLRFIGQECRRLSSLIENVLDFSRIEQGHKQYEFEPADVVALTRTTVKLMEPGATEKEVKLALSIQPHSASAIELNVDGRAIQQALVNLIDNAIKHSPKGETVTVEIDVKPGIPPNSNFPAVVCLSVTDHGPGIPPAEHKRIFERFYRLGSELRRETQGVGIGLSIVQHIVTAHGGRIAVESAPGKGSRFTIELPMSARNHHE